MFQVLYDHIESVKIASQSTAAFKSCKVRSRLQCMLCCVSNLSCILLDQETLLWDQKDWSDAGLSDESDEEEEQPVQVVRRRTKSSSTSSQDTGVTYSDDVWFLIGRFVDPEDVLRFALICRATHCVTHLVGFWTNLYKR